MMNGPSNSHSSYPPYPEEEPGLDLTPLLPWRLPGQFLATSLIGLIVWWQGPTSGSLVAQRGYAIGVAVVILSWFAVRIARAGQALAVGLSTAFTLLVLGLIAYRWLDQPRHPPEHWPRWLATLFPPGLGLWLALTVQPTRSMAHRLLFAATGLLLAVLAWWFVPTKNGVNLFAARQQRERLLERLRGVAAEDVDGFLADAGARKAIGTFPALVDPLMAEERAWVDGLVVAMQGRDTKGMHQAVLELWRVLPPALLDPAGWHRLQSLEERFVAARVAEAARGMTGPRAAAAAHLESALAELRSEVATIDAAARCSEPVSRARPPLGPTARQALLTAYARARGAVAARELDRLRPLAAREPATALPKLAELSEELTLDLQRTDNHSHLQETVTAVKTLWLATRHSVWTGRLEALRRDVLPLLRAGRFQVAAERVVHGSKALHAEAEALGRLAELQRTRDAFAYVAELARAAGARE